VDQQYQSTEASWKNWTQPGKSHPWPDPVFIRHKTFKRSDVADSTPVFRCLSAFVAYGNSAADDVVCCSCWTWCIRFTQRRPLYSLDGRKRPRPPSQPRTVSVTAQWQQRQRSMPAQVHCGWLAGVHCYKVNEAFMVMSC